MHNLYLFEIVMAPPPPTCVDSVAAHVPSQASMCLALFARFLVLSSVCQVFEQEEEE